MIQAFVQYSNAPMLGSGLMSCWSYQFPSYAHRSIRSYSSICRSFMVHTDKNSVITASIQAVSKAAQGSSASGSKGVSTMNTTTNTNIRQPRIKRIQALVVARALNICGILAPPVKSLVRVYTLTRSFSITIKLERTTSGVPWAESGLAGRRETESRLGGKKCIGEKLE